MCKYNLAVGLLLLTCCNRKFSNVFMCFLYQ